MWNDTFKYKSFHVSANIQDNDCLETFLIKRTNQLECYTPIFNKNEWIFLRIPNKLTTYEFCFDAKIKTVNSEFQIAFNYESIGKRYRFNLVNNKTLSFDIVNNGEFFNNLIRENLSLNLEEWYHFQLKVHHNIFQYIINNRIILSIKLESKHLLKGDIVLILWNSDAKPIHVLYKNLQLKSIM